MSGDDFSERKMLWNFITRYGMRFNTNFMYLDWKLMVFLLFLQEMEIIVVL